MGIGAGRAGRKTKLIFPLHKQAHPALHPVPDETLTPCSATAAQMQMGQDSFSVCVLACACLGVGYT